ncbi:MAG: CAAX prenyl protease-related protein [Gammaproteobacteria bacterium]|nr:CAAX prenyl protease-related protein [Gammaproteobacteria bacterium]
MSLISRPAFSRIFPFAIYIAFLAIASGMSTLQDMGYIRDWDLRWLYPVKVGLVLLALLGLWRHYSELSRLSGVKVVDWVVAAITGVVVFVIWINLDQAWATMGGESRGFNPVSEDGEINWMLVVFRLIGAAMIVPVMEELFWRSFVMRWIDNPDFLRINPARISIRSFVIASVLFGIEHNLWLAGIIAGIAYGWLYKRSANLWVPVFSHAVTNGLLGIWVIYSGNWQFW